MNALAFVRTEREEEMSLSTCDSIGRYSATNSVLVSDGSLNQ